MSAMLKYLCLTLAVLLMLGGLTACQPSREEPDGTEGSTADSVPSQESGTPDSDPEGGESSEDPTGAPSDGHTTEPEDPEDPDAANTRPAQEVKVISMNLDANEATAGSRVRLMAPLLLSLDPDSIGVQEARGSWINLLKRNFLAKGYARVGVDAGGGQDAANGYFATYILYKEDKFDLVDWGTFWLSTTPDVPSKYGPTVDTNRTCTWALLEDKETGFRYVHMNAHLDWMDMEVNRIQVEMIQNQIERFESMGYPVFAGGDYNCDEGTASYLKMLESEAVADAKKVAETANDIATYPSYGDYDVYDPAQRPIDYFFVTAEHMTVHEYRVVDEKPDGKYISDHFPVFVRATVKAMPKTEEAAHGSAFADGTALTVETTQSGFSVTFPQAKDARGVIASQYRVVLSLDGKEIAKLQKSSGVLLLDTPETLTCTLGGLDESGTYTVTVTPINIFGEEGQPLEAEAEFTLQQAEPSEMGPADIVDIRVEGGAVKDSSPNAYEAVRKGTVTLTETPKGMAMEFTGSGNYAVSGVRNHYAALEDGFTMEVSFKTPADLSGFHSLASNMHAGGYGMDWEDGDFTFSVRVGSAYVGVDCALSPETDYHAVGVFTGNGVKLYVNGILMGETPVDGGLVHPTDDGAKYLCIGADSDASGAGEYPCRGLVYFVRMYSEAATDGQAAYLYQQAAAD